MKSFFLGVFVASVFLGLTGCVFQPVHIEVYIPTEAVVTDSTVSVDASKAVQP